jgi:hypothetical protein
MSPATVASQLSRYAMTPVLRDMYQPLWTVASERAIIGLNPQQGKYTYDQSSNDSDNAGVRVPAKFVLHGFTVSLMNASASQGAIRAAVYH